VDFDLNKDPHIDLKADISHSDELLRSIPLEVLEGAQSAQKESFMMRLQGMPWMLKKMLYFLRWFIVFAGISSNAVHFHMPRIRLCDAYLYCTGLFSLLRFAVPKSTSRPDRTARGWR